MENIDSGARNMTVPKSTCPSFVTLRCSLNNSLLLTPKSTRLFCPTRHSETTRHQQPNKQPRKANRGDFQRLLIMV
jgi:hypothetical protein